MKLEFRLKESEFAQFLNLLTWAPSDSESYTANSSDTFRKVFKAGLMWLAENPAARMSQVRTPNIPAMEGVTRLPIPVPRPRVLKGGPAHTHVILPADGTPGISDLAKDLGKPGASAPPPAKPEPKPKPKGKAKSAD